MNFLFKVKQFFYSIVFYAFEFTFFFTHYWWWKFQWLLTWKYWNTSGHEIFKKERELVEGLEEDNFSFGETTALSTKLLLQEINPQRSSVIYDLGSGRGTFLFSAYFLFNLRGVGVEIFKTYVDKCRQVQKSLKVAGIIFNQGNLVDLDLSEADIVYFAGATFEQSIVDAVIENLKKTSAGTVVIIVRHLLPEGDFVLFNEGYFPFSWGSDKVYFYKKK